MGFPLFSDSAKKAPVSREDTESAEVVTTLKLAPTDEAFAFRVLD
jgi:hypothetical protein